ncbi:MAG: TraB/GumN family protein [Alphaproteobacteria bacterium]|nr:TraB/GumN family protein [Alphaproteobacteria bacterium]
MFLPSVRKLLAALVIVLALPAFADDATTGGGVVYAKMPAHPAMWTAHGRKGTAYLFGSIHVLPANVDWHTKEIDAAMARSDVMVFELAFGDKLQGEVQSYIQTRGKLPEGQHLRDMLSPEAKGEFDAELENLSIAPAAVDHLRPWLASLMFDIAEMKKKNYSSAAGVEMSLKDGDGGAAQKPVIGLETIEQQMALIVPSDPKVELESFEASLKSSKTEAQGDDVGPMLDAWMHAKTDRLDALMGKAFKNYPAARKALLDDRNQAWAEKLASMLDNDDKTYFVTVGAAHLVGPGGVPNLLRRRGYRVKGP